MGPASVPRLGCVAPSPDVPTRHGTSVRLPRSTIPIGKHPWHCTGSSFLYLPMGWTPWSTSDVGHVSDLVFLSDRLVRADVSFRVPREPPILPVLLSPFLLEASTVRDVPRVVSEILTPFPGDLLPLESQPSVLPGSPSCSDLNRRCSIAFAPMAGQPTRRPSPFVSFLPLPLPPPLLRRTDLGRI